MEKYNKILSELKFLSKLRKGEKIMVKTMTVQQGDFFSGLYRTFVGETREATLDFICEVWDKTVELICDEETTEECRKSLCENLNESRKGVISLIGTYEDDRYFCSRLESLVATTENQIIQKVPSFSLCITKENAGLARTIQAQEASLRKI
uniref:Uncharacterized protein n=1 Tax=Marseillevirus sp. TaxID=2809551 RepID=A0AA96IXL2_9VIRU|nr:hypothetical protein MarFTMF_282 [Marseillevirus sp.]